METNNSLGQPVTNQTPDEEQELLSAIRAEAEAMRNGSETTEEPEVQKVEGQPEQVEEVEPSNDKEVESESSDEVEVPTNFEKPIVLKDRGVEIPVNNMDELIKLAQQGVMTTRKTMELAPYRKQVEYIKQAGLEEADLQMLADIKAGNKEAINGLAKKYSMDLYSVDTEAEYVPQTQVYVPSPVDEVATEIMQNESLATSFKNVIQYVPDSFKAKLGTDADVLRGFAQDVERGIAQKILPEANKLMLMHPNADFIQAYVEAGNRIFGQQQVEPTTTTPRVVNAGSDAKAKAGVTSSKQSTVKSNDDLDIWENGLSDAELIARIQTQADRLRNSKQTF